MGSNIESLDNDLLPITFVTHPQQMLTIMDLVTRSVRPRSPFGILSNLQAGPFRDIVLEGVKVGVEDYKEEYQQAEGMRYQVPFEEIAFASCLWLAQARSFPRRDSDPAEALKVVEQIDQARIWLNDAFNHGYPLYETYQGLHLKL